MPFFPNTELIIKKYIASEGYDDYGEKTGEYIESESIPVDFQPLSPQESIKEYGEILQDTYKIYIDLDTEITPQDQIIIDDETYAIIGTPSKMNHFTQPSHIKINIQKLRGMG